MRRAALGAAAILLAWGGAPEAGMMRMVVADLPYARVWDAALRAVASYPIERAADGVIVTGWATRSPRTDEPGFGEVTERVTLRVEPFGERVTRVTVEVEARGWREGSWVSIPDTRPRAREILARLRDAPD